MRKLLLITLISGWLWLPAWAQSGATPRQVEYASVEVIGLKATRTSYEAVGWGTGAFVDSNGLVLTAFRVVGDPSTGKLLNDDGLVGLALINQPGEAAAPAYLGKVMTYSVSLDLALVETTWTLDGRPLPAYTLFPVLPLPGLRDHAPEPGAALTVYGFGSGFDRPLSVVTGTLVRYGQVSGFGGRPLVLSSTAALPYGFAGGPVLGANGVPAGVALGATGRGAAAQNVVRPWEEIRTWASGQVSGTAGLAPVVITARIVDANTRRGIASAAFVILRPNVEPADYLAEPSDADVAARGLTDRNGVFVTDPPVAFNIAYHLVVWAAGYRTTYTSQPVLLDAQTCPGQPRCEFGTIELESTRR
jgi:hypothetical protein